jgi:hypothetical protein
MGNVFNIQDQTNLASVTGTLAVANGGTGLTSKPYFSVNKGGTNQTGLTTGQNTRLTWPTEDWDTTGDFASNVFTCTVAGKYRFAAGCYCVDAPTSSILSLRKNGTVVKVLASITGYYFTAGFADLQLVATDVVDVVFYHEKGSDATISGAAANTYFSGELVAG